MLKFVGALLVIVGLTGYVLFAHSSTSTSYECPGTMTNDAVASEKTAFIVVTRYRWWTQLWGDYQGDVWLELPGETVRSLPNGRLVGGMLQFSDWQTGQPAGYFSFLSGALEIDMRPLGWLEARCTSLQT